MERMLDKYVIFRSCRLILFNLHLFFQLFFLICIYADIFYLLGVFQMENFNKQWEWPLSVDDWIN